jgi:hypothetical protein
MFGKTCVRDPIDRSAALGGAAGSNPQTNSEY